MNHLSKVTNFVKKNKVQLLAVGVLSAQVVSKTCYALTVDIATPLTAAMTDTVTNTIACFSAIIPIGLTIFGAKFAWIKGVQFFSSIAAK